MDYNKPISDTYIFSKAPACNPDKTKYDGCLMFQKNIQTVPVLNLLCINEYLKKKIIM